MTSADIVELRRMSCSAMGELGTVVDHIGTLSDTIHTPSTPAQDARARAETLASAEEAAGMLGILADELAKEIRTLKVVEEDAASNATTVRPAPTPLKRRSVRKERAA